MRLVSRKLKKPLLFHQCWGIMMQGGCQLNRSGCSIDSRGATNSLCFKVPDANPAELRPNRKRTFGCGIRVYKI